MLCFRFGHFFISVDGKDGRAATPLDESTLQPQKKAGKIFATSV